MDDLTTIIRRVRQGQTEAFAGIVARFQPMAVGYALSILGDPQRAREAAQNAFVTAWLNLDGVRDEAAFPGWFRRVVHTECARLRRSTGPPTVPLADTDHESGDAGADAALRATRDGELVDALVARLPELSRQVVILHYLAQLSQKEVAAFLDVPEGTVKKRLHDARQRLRRELDDMTDPRPTLLDDDGFGPRVVALVTTAAEAIATGDATRLRALLAEHPSLVHVGGALDFRYGDDSYFAGATLLHHVAGNPTPHIPMPPKAVDLVGVLLAAGADPNATTAAGNTALALVAGSRAPRLSGQQIDLIDALIAGGADPDGGGGLAPLANALLHGELDAGRALRAHGARLDLRLAAGLGDVDAMREFFDDSGALRPGAGGDPRDLEPGALQAAGSVPPPDEAGLLSLALGLAVINGQRDAARFVVERGADVNAVVPRLHGGGLTPLHHACSGVSQPGDAGLDMVRWLLERGADPARRDESGPGATPVGWAVHGGRAHLLDPLLAADATEAGSLLRYAVRRLGDDDGSVSRAQRLEVVRCLLAAGADPDEGPSPTAREAAGDDGELRRLLDGGVRGD